LYLLKNNIKYTKFENKNKLYNHIMKSEILDETFNKDIYFNDTVLEKLIKLSKLDKSSLEYKSIYQDIIKVGEYKL